MGKKGMKSVARGLGLHLLPGHRTVHTWRRHPVFLISLFQGRSTCDLLVLVPGLGPSQLIYADPGRQALLIACGFQSSWKGEGRGGTIIHERAYEWIILRNGIRSRDCLRATGNRRGRSIVRFLINIPHPLFALDYLRVRGGV